MTPIEMYSLNVDWSDIRQVQRFISLWASDTFPNRKPDAALFKLIMAEIPEMLTHKNKYGTDGIGPELADCFILLMDLATIWGVDLSVSIRQKMRTNIRRHWVEDKASGTFQHVEEAESEGGEI